MTEQHVAPGTGAPGSQRELAERYATAVMNTFGPPKRVLVAGRGCHVWDADGRRYLDLMAGIAVNALGHAHPAVVEAMTTQASRLGHVSNFFTSEPQIVLAERLLTLAGCGDGRVFFCNSGAEANEAAVKVTRRTGRRKIVAAHGAFHGRTLGALSLTAKAAYRAPFEPLPGDVHWVPYGDGEALSAAVDGDTAAIVLEPIQGEAGVVVPPDGYLAAARRIADREGALLWLDEVQTGVGRTGSWFGFQAESEPVRPDVVTVAKGLGGGFPIGACIGFGPAASLLTPGQHGTTFGGNPVACATALAVLDVIESDGLLESVSHVGAELSARLRRVDGVRSVRGRGLLLAAELEPGTARQAVAAALDGGVIVNDPTPDAVRLAPPLILQSAHVDEALPVLATAIAQQRQPAGVAS
jgi:acetylornithine/N-succinyldiaminopimelate aminotransferase